MEIFEENIETLKDIWEDKLQRQSAKMVIASALQVTELTVKQANDVLDELDRLLLNESEDDKVQKNPGL